MSTAKKCKMRLWRVPRSLTTIQLNPSGSPSIALRTMCISSRLSGSDEITTPGPIGIQLAIKATEVVARHRNSLEYKDRFHIESDLSPQRSWHRFGTTHSQPQLLLTTAAVEAASQRPTGTTQLAEASCSTDVTRTFSCVCA